ERLLLLGGDRLRDLAQAKELPAPVLLPAAVAEVVRRVVADLLQPEQVREDDPTAPGFVRPCPELPRERVDSSLVERCLHAGETAVRLHLGLVGQVRDDVRIVLPPPEKIRLHEPAQRRIRLLPPPRERLREARERARRSEEPRVQEVEERPEIGEPVLHRRPGEREPAPPAERFHRARLPCYRVLCVLRLV